MNKKITKQANLKWNTRFIGLTQWSPDSNHSGSYAFVVDALTISLINIHARLHPL